jgi:hypothetical protein
MAVRIPIITDFNGQGIQRAKKEFAQLEGIGAKSAFAIRKAFIPATAALAGLAKVGFDAVQAAVDDAAAQAKLADQLGRTTRATQKQIIATGDFIDELMFATNVVDDDLRPALSSLATATGDLEEAQKLLTLAVDISTATGKPLEQVAQALGRAYNDQFLALNKLDPSMKALIKDGATAEQVFAKLNEKFGGAAAAQVETTAGRFANFKIRMDELKESIGASLLPAVEGLLPLLQRMADWAGKNPELFRNIAVAIGAISAAIVVLNVALAVNPIVLLAGAIVGLAAVMALNWPKVKKFFEDFRAEIDKTLGPLDELVGLFFEGFGQALGIGDSIFQGSDPRFNDPRNRPKRQMASGGLVMTPTSAIVGEAGPELVIPLDRLGQFGGGGNNVVINVNGGDPQAVVDALVRYSRQNGALPPQVKVQS